MSNFVCPACQCEISLASNIAAPQTCGLCGAEFVLQAVLLRASPMLPPTSSADQAMMSSAASPSLTLLDPSGGDDVSHLHDLPIAGVADASARDSSAALTPSGDIVEIPLSEQRSAIEDSESELPLADTVIYGEGQIGAPVPRPGDDSSHAETASDQGSPSNLAVDLSDDEEDDDRIVTGDSAEATESTEPTEESAEDTSSESPAEASASSESDYFSAMAAGDTSQPQSMARTIRSRPKGPSMMAHMIGVIGGGVLGLSIGYYLLNLFGGEKFDFLNIPLPGIRHTQQPADGGSGLRATEPPRAPLA